MKKCIGFVLIAIMTIVSACGNNNGGITKKSEDPSTVLKISDQPVTLQVAYDYSILNGAANVEQYKKLVSQKYPNITLEIVDASGAKLDALLVAGQVPDIINTYTTRMPSYADKVLLDDQTPLLKRIGVDLSKIEESYVRDVRVLSDKGELYGIPIFVNFWALYYNKDLFDKFGVPYPTDGMTWDNVAELAKKLTWTDGGVKYYGITPPDWLFLANQMSIPLLDPKTSKSNFNSESFRKVIQLGEKVAKAVDLKPNEKIGDFYKDGTVAMTMDSNKLTSELSKVTFNWNVVQAPSIDKPNLFPSVSPHVLFVTKTSKHKDQAMQAISVMISDEMQKWFAEQASTPVSKSSDILKAFATNYPQLKEKNINSIFKSKPSTAVPATLFSIKANAIVNKYYGPFISGAGPDLNTLLRQVDEEINHLVTTESGK